jgi:anti-sigma-K factor RskA
MESYKIAYELQRYILAFKSDGKEFTADEFVRHMHYSRILPEGDIRAFIALHTGGSGSPIIDIAHEENMEALMCVDNRLNVLVASLKAENSQRIWRNLKFWITTIVAIIAIISSVLCWYFSRL